jgi:hypothetical protein
MTLSRMTGRAAGSRTRRSTGTIGPTDAKGTPAARWPAIGAKMSRPWKLLEIPGSISSRFSSERASTRPPSASPASISNPLSGPTRMSPRPVRRATASRLVPTPDRPPRRDPLAWPEEEQRPGAVSDRIARYLVRDVDDPGLGTEAVHHGAADGRRGWPEVGGERDDGTHPRIVRAAAPGRPDMSKRRRESAPLRRTS